MENLNVCYELKKSADNPHFFSFVFLFSLSFFCVETSSDTLFCHTFLEPVTPAAVEIHVNLWNFILIKSYSAYHSKCIDPWLTRNRRVCPVCKRRVLARGEQLSESESENSDDETRPLLRPGSYGTQGGTFIHPPVSPISQTSSSVNIWLARFHSVVSSIWFGLLSRCVDFVLFIFSFSLWSCRMKWNGKILFLFVCVF